MSDAQSPTRNRGGRPKGSRNKVGGERTPSPGWLRATFAGCFTQEQWRQKFKGLSDREQLELLSKLEPREVRADLTTSVRLLIDGLPARPVIHSRPVAGELPASTGGNGGARLVEGDRDSYRLVAGGTAPRLLDDDSDDGPGGY